MAECQSARNFPTPKHRATTVTHGDRDGRLQSGRQGWDSDK